MKQTGKLRYILLALMLVIIANASYLFIIDNAFALFKDLPRTPIFNTEPGGIKFLEAAVLLFSSTLNFGSLIRFSRNNHRKRKDYLLFIASIQLLTVAGYILTDTQAAVKFPLNNSPATLLPLAYGAIFICYISGLLIMFQLLKETLTIALRRFRSGTMCLVVYALKKNGDNDDLIDHIERAETVEQARRRFKEILEMDDLSYAGIGTEFDTTD